jgi:hypothetical protein
MTDQPGLHSLYSTGSGGGATTFTTGLILLFAGTRLVMARFTGRLLRRPADLVDLVARIVSALTRPL